MEQDPNTRSRTNVIVVVFDPQTKKMLRPWLRWGIYLVMGDELSLEEEEDEEEEESQQKARKSSQSQAVLVVDAGGTRQGQQQQQQQSNTEWDNQNAKETRQGELAFA